MLIQAGRRKSESRTECQGTNSLDLEYKAEGESIWEKTRYAMVQIII